MAFVIPLDKARADYPEYVFVKALAPSEQKAAFHVRDRQGEDLCLKIIAPSYGPDRLDREIQALQAINHPNVVKLKEYTFSSKAGQQRHYMVEEFVEGEDLADSMKPGQPWSLTDAATLFASVADGLSALRERNIVHRDLKPRNIRVRTGGEPVIIDFGLARHLDLPDLTSTTQGAAIGTPLYFAPEQADVHGTKHDIEHRTDLFALGVMLYEALVGRHPFLAAGVTTVPALMKAICESTNYLVDPAFAALPPKWRLLIGRLLEKERAKRPQSAEQVAKILRKIGTP
jgi:serine/threonine protein kinase